MYFYDFIAGIVVRARNSVPATEAYSSSALTRWLGRLYVFTRMSRCCLMSTLGLLWHGGRGVLAFQSTAHGARATLNPGIQDLCGEVQIACRELSEK